MSCVRCDRCAWLIDSDDDPDCFTQDGKYGAPILCENCREEDDAELADLEDQLDEAVKLPIK